jgi:tetratricopeptide (TPR) repeat protein
MRGEPDLAIAAYEKAVAFDPQNAKLHTTLGSALQAKGRTEEALAAFEKAVALAPEFAPAHLSLGFA